VIELRRRLRLSADNESGLTLIEVVVAMMIFMIISVGVVYTMLSVISVSRDSRARQVAQNLAAEEIDRARSVDDVTTLVSWSTNTGTTDPNDATRLTGAVTLNGDKFTVKREVQWVSNPDSALSCGASGSSENLRYKRVNVTVTWNGMRGLAVRSDTIINPKERVNDPLKGSILVSVKTAGGTGASGITVTTTPAITPAPLPTDLDGCTYILKVTPGTYTVKISKTNYVDDTNNAAPSTSSVSVVAGQTTSLKYQYDLAATYSVTYPTSASPTSAVRPTSLETSLINTYRRQVMTTASPYKMHPFTGGYVLVAGDVTKCPAVDPANWTETPTRELAPFDYYATTPGGSVSVPVPMGSVKVSGQGGGTILAVSADPTGADHPKCTTKVTYTFTGDSATRNLALPFGTWKLYKGTEEASKLFDTVMLDPRTKVS